MANIQEAAEKGEFRLMFFTAIVTSLVFVVGLFWNEAMKAFIESILPASDEVSAKFAAALIVTTVVGFLIFLLYRSMKFADFAKKEIGVHTFRLLKELERRQKELDKNRIKLEKALRRNQ